MLNLGFPGGLEVMATVLPLRAPLPQPLEVGPVENYRHSSSAFPITSERFLFSGQAWASAAGLRSTRRPAAGPGGPGV